jgi:type IV pilus assembly protein PilA
LKSHDCPNRDGSPRRWSAAPALKEEDHTMRKYIRIGKRGFTLVELMIVVAIVGILAALAIYGVRKYISNAKTAEAKNSLGQIGKDSSTAFEKETMAATTLTAGGTASTVRALCALATNPVPSVPGLIKGTKYQANQGPNVDWNQDATNNKGFSCIKFSMSAPQYYMYNYTSNGDQNTPSMGNEFTATANGDLNGDGVLSTFQVYGTVDAASNLYISPSIYEASPEE